MSGLAQLLSEEPVSDATWLQRREQPASLPESVVARLDLELVPGLDSDPYLDPGASGPGSRVLMNGPPGSGIRATARAAALALGQAALLLDLAALTSCPDLSLSRLDLVYSDGDADDCPVALMEELAAAVCDSDYCFRLLAQLTALTALALSPYVTWPLALQSDDLSLLAPLTSLRRFTMAAAPEESAHLLALSGAVVAALAPAWPQLSTLHFSAVRGGDDDDEQEQQDEGHNNYQQLQQQGTRRAQEQQAGKRRLMYIGDPFDDSDEEDSIDESGGNGGGVGTVLDCGLSSDHFAAVAGAGGGLRQQLQVGCQPVRLEHVRCSRRRGSGRRDKGWEGEVAGGRSGRGSQLTLMPHEPVPRI
eukprot:XP_001700658.1 predicted protein [Chlamydomonas reinhardtii]